MLNLLTQWHFQYFQKLKVTNNKLLIVFIFCYCFLNNNIIAQKIFSSEYSSDSDLKVFVVDYESQDDLKVLFDVSEYDRSVTFYNFIDIPVSANTLISYTNYSSFMDNYKVDELNLYLLHSPLILESTNFPLKGIFMMFINHLLEEH